MDTISTSDRISAHMWAGCVALAGQEVESGTAELHSILGTMRTRMAALGLDLDELFQKLDESPEMIALVAESIVRAVSPKPTKVVDVGDACVAVPVDSRPGFVYLIENAAAGSVKIGYSVDPANRLKSLQTSSPAPLRMVTAFVGTVSDEASLHKRFSARRLSGEWFSAHPEIFAEFARRTQREASCTT